MNKLLAACVITIFLVAVPSGALAALDAFEQLIYAPAWAGQPDSGTFMWNMNHGTMPNVPPGTSPPWPTAGVTKPDLYGPTSWAFNGTPCICRQWLTGNVDPSKLYPADPPYMDLHRDPIWADYTKGGWLGGLPGGFPMWNLQVGGGPEGGQGVSWVLPNSEEPNPLKLVRVQVGWWCPEGSTQQIRFVGGTAGGPYTVTQVGWGDKVHRYGPAGFENKLVVSWFDLLIQPNPCTEEIFVQFYDSVTGLPSYSGWIDDIRFDTICMVPEPGTMMLAGFGVLALLLSRRKR